MTDYSYSIATDFVNLDVAGVVHLGLLQVEVGDSAIASGLPLLDVKCAGDTVTFVFTGTLTSGDETILDGIVAAHTGTWPGAAPGEGPPNYYEVSAINTVQTTLATYVDVPSMVVNDVTAGKWLATYMTTGTSQDDNEDVTYTIAINDVVVTSSQRAVTIRHSGINYLMTTQAFLTLADGDKVAVRYRSYQAGKFVAMYERNLILARLE